MSAGQCQNRSQLPAFVSRTIRRLLVDHVRRLVEGRFVGGMRAEEIADALNVSPRAVERDGLRAHAYLDWLLHPGPAVS